MQGILVGGINVLEQLTASIVSTEVVALVSIEMFILIYKTTWSHILVDHSLCASFPQNTFIVRSYF